jgi:hypothetical protein
MRRLGISAKIAVVLALAAAGFSVASIANGESPMAVLTGTETVTTTQVTTQVTTTVASTTVPTTTTVVVSRKVALCHKTGSKKHPYVTIKVAQTAVKAHLRHGDAFGACTTKTVKALKAKALKAKLAKLKAKKHKGHK